MIQNSINKIRSGIMKIQLNTSTLIIMAIIFSLGFVMYFSLSIKLSAISQNTFRVIENINSIQIQEK